MSVESLVSTLAGLASAGEGDAAVTSRARAVLARLRRAVSSPEGTVEAYRYIAPHVPADEDPSDYLLIGSLFGANPRHVGGRTRNLGTVCAELGREQDNSISPAADRRFAAMLSSRRCDLAPHLRRVIMMANRQRIAIDYLRLFYDLRRWEDEARPSQLAWARSFYPSKADVPVEESGWTDTPIQES